MNNIMVFENFTSTEFYDADLGSCIDDIPFWLEVTNQEKEVMEIGCGTGRVVIPLGERGSKVYGVDNSKQMLHELHKKIKNNLKLKKKITTYNEDCRNFSLNKQFNTIISADITLNHMLTKRDIHNTFQSIRKHLRLEGRLIFDMVNPDHVHITEEKQLCKQRECEKYFMVWAKGTYFSKKKIYRVANYYQYCDQHGVPESGKIIQVKLWYRLYDPQEMESIIKKSGFKIIRKYGDYEGTPFTAKSPLQVFILQKNNCL